LGSRRSHWHVPSGGAVIGGLHRHPCAYIHRDPQCAECQAPVPLRVDVTRYASWAGAYTTLAPDHLTVAGTDPRNHGPNALECVLHEASHAIVRPLREALDKELQAQGKSSDDLWHAVLFYSTGYAVQRRIGHRYVPYVYKYGLYAHGTWSM
jgi:hypothetical protein